MKQIRLKVSFNFIRLKVLSDISSTSVVIFAYIHILYIVLYLKHVLIIRYQKTILYFDKNQEQIMKINIHLFHK